MTSAIVEFLSGQEESALVATISGGVPFHDIGDLFSVRWLSGAKDKDSTTSGRLASDVPRESGVTVLEIFHGNVVTRRDLKFRECGSIVGCPLLWRAYKVGGVDVCASCRIVVSGGGVGEEPQH